MGFMKISNLYKDRTVLMFKEVYALEKVHGTSTHVLWRNGDVTFYEGGCSYLEFIKLFDKQKLMDFFAGNFPKTDVCIFGEGYGGKMQGMSKTYGQGLKFIAFDVRVGERWLCVPEADHHVTSAGLSFVSYTRISTDIESIDGARDADSSVAAMNGCGKQIMEGVILRPLQEFSDSHGNRVIAKHKRAEFGETKSPRSLEVDPEKLKVLEEAREIAEEWATPIRLQHVLDQFVYAGIEQTRDVIDAMIHDIVIEGKGEFIDCKETRGQIGKRTAMLFKEHLQNKLKEDLK